MCPVEAAADKAFLLAVGPMRDERPDIVGGGYLDLSNAKEPSSEL
jgi:hypothetical protein